MLGDLFDGDLHDSTLSLSTTGYFALRHLVRLHANFLRGIRDRMAAV